MLLLFWVYFSLIPLLLPSSPESVEQFLEMVKLRKLVETEETMEKFIVDYRIPPNVSLRYCKEGEWHLKRRTGEVVIPLLAFIEGGCENPYGAGNEELP